MKKPSDDDDDVRFPLRGHAPPIRALHSHTRAPHNTRTPQDDE